MEFEGRDISHVAAHELVQLGIGQAPEGRRIFSRLTIFENLLMGGFTRSKAENAEQVEHVYQLFPRLRERAGQKGGTLSGGEQQMLAIGRALMTRPSVLLLDEPSLGLSPILVQQIFRIIGEINASGMTILLVEQNALQALSVAHRGYVLQTGQVVLAGQLEGADRGRDGPQGLPRGVVGASLPWTGGTRGATADDPDRAGRRLGPRPADAVLSSRGSRVALAVLKPWDWIAAPPMAPGREGAAIAGGRADRGPDGRLRRPGSRDWTDAGAQVACLSGTSWLAVVDQVDGPVTSRSWTRLDLVPATGPLDPAIARTHVYAEAVPADRLLCARRDRATRDAAARPFRVRRARRW